jgi:dolichyl-phosphate-mannose-protein mannosyltransferase
LHKVSGPAVSRPSGCRDTIGPMQNFWNGPRSALEPLPDHAQTRTPDQARVKSANEPLRVTSVLSSILDRPTLMVVIFAVLGLSFFLAGIGRPPLMYYDEGFFVPEARSFLLSSPSPDSLIQMHSLAKPPLGKLMMAAGIKAAGDNPFGWRVASAISGALALVAVYLWTLLLVQNRHLAAVAAGMTLFNGFHFVMSRIGMMDVFLVLFLMWSLLTYTAAIVLDLGVGKRRILVICAGLLMGLAGASKWNAVDSLAVLLFVSLALWSWSGRRSPMGSSSPLACQARHVREIGLPTLVAGLVAAPAVSYVLTYWPQCRLIKQPFSFHELIALHRIAWTICTTWKSNPTIISPWYTWPLSLSPQRGLSYLLGNPVVAWGGLLALIFCVWRFCKAPALPEVLVVLLYSANLLQWAVTPEEGLFYYYYYPAVMILGVAIAVSLRSLPERVAGARVGLVVLVAAACVFLRFYPQMAHLEAPWDCLLGCWS